VPGRDAEEFGFGEGPRGDDAVADDDERGFAQAGRFVLGRIWKCLQVNQFISETSLGDDIDPETSMTDPRAWRMGDVQACEHVIDASVEKLLGKNLPAGFLVIRRWI
jgi:hypothetical protein